MQTTVHRRSAGVLLILAGLWLASRPPAAHAQAPPETPSAGTAGSDAVDAGRRHPRRVYLGMWTMHLRNDALRLDSNWAIGATARGVFGATFLNSYGRRAFAGGLQRTFAAAERRPFGASLGYRLGFVTGYDERMMSMAKHSPVLPLVQPFALVDVHGVGLEVSYTFVVVSFTTSYGF